MIRNLKISVMSPFVIRGFFVSQICSDSCLLRLVLFFVSICHFALSGCDSSSQERHSSQISTSMMTTDLFGPIAEFERIAIDLGDVPLNSMADSRTVTFNLRNIGTEPLSLRELRLTCGCTTAKAVPEVVAPGEAGEVSVIVRLGVSGERTVSITVLSNCVNNSAIPLSIRWNAIAPVQVAPELVDFGRMLIGTEDSAVIRLQRSPSGECPESQIRVFVLPSAPGVSAMQDGDVVTVRLKASKPHGVHRDFVNFELTDCWRSSIRVAILWEVIPRI